MAALAEMAERCRKQIETLKFLEECMGKDRGFLADIRDLLVEEIGLPDSHKTGWEAMEIVLRSGEWLTTKQLMAGMNRSQGWISHIVGKNEEKLERRVVDSHYEYRLRPAQSLPLSLAV